MRSALFCAITLLTAGNLAADPSLQRAIDKALHRIDRSGDTYTAVNPSQHLQAAFTPSGTDFVHNKRRFRVALAGSGSNAEIVAGDNRVELRRGRITEWYVNDDKGIEHGFDVAHKDGALYLRLTISGDYRPSIDALGVTLVDNATGQIALRYGGLASWDASGQSLPSQAQVRGNEIHLLVDDSQARYPVTVDPIFREAVIRPSDATPEDRFGLSLAATHDTVVVGAPGKNNMAGEVYVFTRFKGAWVEQVRIPSPVQGEAYFGHTVAIHGNTIVVGAPLEQVDSKRAAGAAYVFTRNDSGWNLERRLVAPDPQSFANFGVAVALHQDTVVVSAPFSDEPIVGPGVYVFTRSNGLWTPQANLLAGPGLVGVQYFGISVALDGNTLAVGATSGGIANAATQGGIVAIFVRSGTAWSRQQVLGVPVGNLNDSKIRRFGISLALQGNTLLVGAPALGPSDGQAGAVFAFSRQYLEWQFQAALVPSVSFPGDGFGYSVALAGNAAIIGAPGALRSPTGGAAYLFIRRDSSWSEAAQFVTISPLRAGARYGSSVAFAGRHALAAATSNLYAGEVHSFRLENVSIQSNPPGQLFSLSGPGCDSTPIITTPYVGFFTNCLVRPVEPNVLKPSTRVTFQKWEEINSPLPALPISPNLPGFSPNPVLPLTTFTANFLNEYELTTEAVPSSGGAVTGAGWYAAGTKAAVAAIPNAGFIFTSFSGGLTGGASPQTVTMDGPKSVTGNFTTTPPATLSGVVTGKSGDLARNRQWTISVTNSGPGTAYNAQLYLMMFTQTFGTPCAAGPVRLTPPTLPVLLGTLAAGQSASTQLSFDFSACPANARFTVTLGCMSNGGSFGGYVQLVNQFR